MGMSGLLSRLINFLSPGIKPSIIHPKNRKRIASDETLEEVRTASEMFSNASLIAEIGTLNTTSPFSSRKNPDMGKDGIAFDKLTKDLISGSVQGD